MIEEQEMFSKKRRDKQRGRKSTISVWETNRNSSRYGNNEEDSDDSKRKNSEKKEVANAEKTINGRTVKLRENRLKKYTFIIIVRLVSSTEGFVSRIR